MKKTNPTKGRYYKMLCARNKNFALRHELVEYAIEHGNKPAARHFGTTVKTVRKWVRRFLKDKTEGLKELSRRPKHSPNKTPEAVEKLVVEQRNKTRGFGARRLVEQFQLPCGHNAAHRILKAHKLTKKCRRKHHKKNDLRVIKQSYKPFTRFQMDTTPLYDEPYYYAQMKDFKLAQHQYTIRELATGAVFVSYATELSKAYTTIVITRCLDYWKSFGIKISQIVIQTDNGPEFDGQVAKYRKGSFHNIIQSPPFCAKHKFNPPRCPNANADVENAHNRFQEELFSSERFSSQQDFFDKVITFQHWFNLKRINCSRHATPLQALRKKAPRIDPNILLLNPINLDHYPLTLGGYDVPRSPEIQFF